MKLVWVLLVLLVSGCASSRSAADPPIVERPASLFPTAPDNFLVAAWGVIWYPSGQDFWREGPRTPLQEALLDHERFHVRRQYKVGLVEYHARYWSDPAFRWQEERPAYEEHAARALREKLLSPADVERWLASIVRSPFYRDMVDDVEAKRWAREVATR